VFCKHELWEEAQETKRFGMERYRDAVPFYPQQGKFASAYYKLGLEQNIDCKSCHLGDDPVILTAEQL
jgi:hypothetical protein